MTLKELLKEAIQHEEHELEHLILFLVFEKKVLSLDDDSSELNFYFKPKFRKRMIEHLKKYQKQINNTPVKYYQVKTPERFYYVKAESSVQAEIYILSKGREIVSIERLLGKTVMHIVDEKWNVVLETTLEELGRNKKTPTFLGGY